MKTYKRAVALFAVLLGAVITLIALAAPSNAAYTPKISINSPACASGTVNGTGFRPGETVTITLQPGGQTVATATASPSGTFTVTATFPSSVQGSRALIATGSLGSSASTRVQINVNCGIGGQSSSRGNGGGATSSGSSGTEGLSATGVAVWTIGGLGVLLLAAGALFTFGGRRGRRA